jgi:type I restriction enzyme M protein
VFFTRGRRTERIWYYDLSHIKVGKKNPLTLDRFFDFFQLLDKRGTPEAETEHSWTLDFAARRTKASEEAAPHRREAEAQRENALRLREQAKAYRRAEKVDLAEQLHSAIDAAERLAREALGKAQAIEDAVYDLKAVNPREKRKTDTRTPAELLAAIREKGLEVDAALARFDQLLAAKQSES